MFQETLIRAEAQYRMARAQATGRTRRRFGGDREMPPPRADRATPILPTTPDRLVPPAVAEPVPSTIDDGTVTRPREHVAA